MPEVRTMTRKSGFTLMELMVVVAIIAIIASLAIPNLMRSRMSANEVSAVGSMRTLSSGQANFQASATIPDLSGMGRYGTLAELQAPTPPFVDQVLGGGMKQGYSFQVDLTRQVLGQPAYDGFANPLGVNFGSRNFWVNEEGVITFTADGSVPNANSDPVQ